MAAVNTNLSLNSQLFGWAGQENDLGITPRAELRFFGSEVLAATGAGNNQAITITIQLPPNFAYVLESYRLQLVGQNSATNPSWSPLSGLLAESNTGNGRWSVPVQSPVPTAGFNGSAVPLTTWTVQDKPQIMIFDGTGGGNSLIQMSTLNATANDTQYVTHFFARFLVYDIAQAFNVSVNTPLLTR